MTKGLTLLILKFAFPLWEQPRTLTFCRLRSSGTCMSSLSYLSSLRRADPSLAADFSSRITTGTNVSYHIDPFEVTSTLYVLYSPNSSAAHWAEGFPFLHGMVTILNLFSSAGFDVCSSSMGYFKISNYFPSFYSHFLTLYSFSLIFLKFSASFFHFFPPLFLLLLSHRCHFKWGANMLK